MSKKRSDRTLRIVITAMFAAMIAVMTAFVQIKTPTGGYVHLGDSMIYLAASFLTKRWDMTWIIWPIAGVGCALLAAILKVLRAKQ